jgi:hypothetical protein
LTFIDLHHRDSTVAHRRSPTSRVMITKITDQMPSPDEVERVKKYLETRGWRTNEEFPPALDR